MRIRALRTSAAFVVSGCVAVTLLATGCGADDSGTGPKGGSGGNAVTSTGGSGTGGSPNASGGAAGGAGTGGTGTGGKATGGSGSGGGNTGEGTGGNKPSTGGGTGGGGTGDSGTGGIGGRATGGASGGGTGGTKPGTGGVQGGGTGGSGTGGSSTGGTGGSGTCAGKTSISKSTCTAGESNCFSFFVASRARMFKFAQAFNGSTKGWGGDFRYGTADGLTGADKLCTQIAEESLAGNCRTWQAFLSTSKVNAIDRVLARFLVRGLGSKLHIFPNSWENLGDAFLDTTGSPSSMSAFAAPCRIKTSACSGDHDH